MASIDYDDQFELYIHSLYFSMMTVTSVGYGSYAYDTGEFICVFLMQILGVVGYASLAGRLISHIEREDKSRAEMEKKLNMLYEMAAELKMDSHLLADIKQDIIYRLE